MMDFIEAHYFIFTYNIGLIIAMAFVATKALKSNKYNDKQIIGIIVASAIWPLMITVNILAAFFNNLRNMLNTLIPTQDVEELPEWPDPPEITDASATVNLDSVTTTGKM